MRAFPPIFIIVLSLETLRIKEKDPPPHTHDRSLTSESPHTGQPNVAQKPLSELPRKPVIALYPYNSMLRQMDFKDGMKEVPTFEGRGQYPAIKEPAAVNVRSFNDKLSDFRSRIFSDLSSDTNVEIIDINSRINSLLGDAC